MKAGTPEIRNESDILPINTKKATANKAVVTCFLDLRREKFRRELANTYGIKGYDVFIHQRPGRSFKKPASGHCFIRKTC
jgi:hypothetical protein